VPAARRVGLRGVLVLTGKTSQAEAAKAGFAGASLAADLAAVVAALRRQFPDAPERLALFPALRSVP